MKTDVFEADLQKHGELHVVVEEHDAVLGDSDEDYIGMRSGNTTVDEKDGVIRVNDGRKSYMIDIDAVIFWTPAQEFPD